MAANGISTLTIPTGITATSFTGSYAVAAGTFNYDSYGAGFSVRKDSGSIDAYIAQVLALPALSAREYVFDQIADELKPFTYGQALISFTLNANGTFSNVVCTYGAGGYHATGATLTMLGTKFVGGVSPGNDIVWDYVCANGDGVITSFAYASGTPPVGRLWTFVPANGQPSFTRAMQTPATNVELPGEIIPTWNIATAGGINLTGAGVNELNSELTPNGTSFNIYATELGTGGGADKEARQTAKLAIAEAKRQGKTVAANGTITGAIDSTKPYYRARNVYDPDRWPTQYSGNTVVDNANSEGLLRARPWTAYNITPTASIVDEGGTLTVNIATLEILDGTTVYWSVSNSGDFGTASGTFVVNNNSGSFTVSPTKDLSTEGTETFNIILRRGSSGGTVVATFSNEEIFDVSLTPTITPAANSVDEGSSLSFAVTNLGPNGTYYWTINHVTTANADFSAVNGSFSLTGGGAQDNGTGSFNITTIADNTTEGAQTFTVSVRSGSISGTVIVTSGSITVNDTSLTASATSGSLFIPGTTSRVTLSPGIVVGGTSTTPFTVEGWFYSTVTPGTDSGPVLLSTDTGSGTPAYAQALTINAASTSARQIVVDSNGAAANTFQFVGQADWLANTWYYVAVTRDTSGYIQAWVGKDGDATATASTTGRFATSGNAAWNLTGKSNCIGAFVPASRYTTGYISNLRVDSTSLFATTAATVPVPTEPFAELAGTVFLQNDDTLTDQTGTQTLTAVGTAAGNALNPFASGDTAGLYRTTYTGYFADDPAFFATATVSSAAVNLSPIGDGDPGFEPFSVQLLGYFKPTTTETHTFFLTSDDASFMWLGATAVTGFTTANAFINNGGVHGSEEVSASIALTAGVYYPIRIQMGDQSGGDVLELNYSTPTIVKTTTVTGKVFYNSATNGF